MKYEEFIELRRKGQIEAGIPVSVAIRLGEHLPNRYQYAVAFWNMVGFLSIIAGLAAIFLYRWWVGLVILFLVAPIIFKANKRSAVQHVLSHAEEDEEFFNLLGSNGWLVFRQ
ncbi:MAG: hypothetical protein H0T51_09750 [Pirellulales bacterium]|nr:hypothetical protein [Pirellulales bacterium]